MNQLTHDWRCSNLPQMGLIIAILALPQVAETILAPALPSLAYIGQISAAQTQWVMSVFFFGFALGVFFWGQLSDKYGRRPAILIGLILATWSTMSAALVFDYKLLLLCRFFQAFGLATCSVTVQTMLRDRLQGALLTRYFVTVGAVLAWSPAVGPLLGQLIADNYGYKGVLWLLAFVLCFILVCAFKTTPETRPSGLKRYAARTLFIEMLGDPLIRYSSLLVAGLNILIFSFYAAGPFMVGKLPGLGFGWIGLAVALVSCCGSAYNRYLMHKLKSEQSLYYGLIGVCIGVFGQYCAIRVCPYPNIYWAILALPIFFGYGLAIPNLLSTALHNYKHCLGTAGALFGLKYYTLLGLGLAVTANLSLKTALPLSIFWCCLSSAMLFAVYRYRSFKTI